MNAAVGLLLHTFCLVQYLPVSTCFTCFFVYCWQGTAQNSHVCDIFVSRCRPALPL